jgi:hypothetical protein
MRAMLPRKALSRPCDEGLIRGGKSFEARSLIRKNQKRIGMNEASYDEK